jgi:hypothetical protein
MNEAGRFLDSRSEKLLNLSHCPTWRTSLVSTPKLKGSNPHLTGRSGMSANCTDSVFRPSWLHSCHPLGGPGAGAGIIGVAVGFGARTLATVVISDIFYLLA